MKKILYLLIFFLTISGTSFAQDDQDDDKTEGGAGRIRERLIEYIQEKLGLTKAEAEKFGPVYIDYFKELRKTNQQFKTDPLVLQQKVAELRLRYREQFKPIIGEKRSNDVFVHERNFIQELRAMRLQNRPNGPANKRFRS